MTLDEIQQEYGMSYAALQNAKDGIADLEFTPEAIIPFSMRHRELYHERYGDAVTREDFIEDWIERNAEGDVEPIMLIGKSKKNLIFVVAFELAADAALFKMEFCIE
jgi:hypothetical protein